MSLPPEHITLNLPEGFIARDVRPLSAKGVGAVWELYERPKPGGLEYRWCLTGTAQDILHWLKSRTSHTEGWCCKSPHLGGGDIYKEPEDN